MANPIDPPRVYVAGLKSVVRQFIPPHVYPVGPKGSVRIYVGLILRPKLRPIEGQGWPRGNPQS